VNNHEDKDASFFIKLDRVESTRNPFRNRNYLVSVAEGRFVRGDCEVTAKTLWSS
jgi:hypothetical protein